MTLTNTEQDTVLLRLQLSSVFASDSV